MSSLVLLQDKKAMTSESLESLLKSDKTLKIVLASILKPLEDVRLYQKIGKSLLKHLPKAELVICAYHPSNKPLPLDTERVKFKRLFGKSRLHIARLGVNARLMAKVFSIRPDYLVIATWELIPAAILLRLFLGVSVVYDVQENYAHNLRYTQVYPWFLRRILAFKIQSLEWFLSFFKTNFILAEACYQEEMPWLHPAVIIQNKCLLSEIKPYQKKDFTPRKIPQLVYSGTISKEYGIFDLIEWAEALEAKEILFSLKIIGFATVKAERNQLKTWANSKKWVELIGVEQPVAHTEILEALQNADAVLMPYKVNQSYAQRIPTKFFECLALQKLMLISHNPFWENYLETFEESKALFLDFKNRENIAQTWAEIQSKLSTAKLLDFSSLSKDIYWESQEQDLINSFSFI